MSSFGQSELTAGVQNLNLEKLNKIFREIFEEPGAARSRSGSGESESSSSSAAAADASLTTVSSASLESKSENGEKFKEEWEFFWGSNSSAAVTDASAGSGSGSSAPEYSKIELNKPHKAKNFEMTVVLKTCDPNSEVSLQFKSNEKTDAEGSTFDPKAYFTGVLSTLCLLAEKTEGSKISLDKIQEHVKALAAYHKVDEESVKEGLKDAIKDTKAERFLDDTTTQALTSFGVIRATLRTNVMRASPPASSSSSEEQVGGATPS